MLKQRDCVTDRYLSPDSAATLASTELCGELQLIASLSYPQLCVFSAAQADVYSYKAFKTQCTLPAQHQSSDKRS